MKSIYFRNHRAGRCVLATASSIAALSAGWLLAGSASAQSTPAGESSSTLTEVVVTAQRRTEVAQKVPIAISAISAATAQAMGIQTNNDLTSMVPSLNISNDGPEMITLRGVGTSGSSVNQEQSVAQYLDGVYLVSPYSNNFPLSAIDRTEVLYGPQGTLFGRNTTGGVIQYISRNPTKDAIEASVGYANYQTTTASFYGSHVFNDDFAMNVAVDYRDQGQGWGSSVNNPQKEFFNNYLSAMVKAVWQPTTTTKVTGLYWRDYDRGSTGPFEPLPGYALANGIIYNPGRFQTFNDTPYSIIDRSNLGYVRVDQDFGAAKFVSLTGARFISDRYQVDADAGPVPLINGILTQPVESFSQEFQLLSPDSSPFKWLLGAFGYRSTAGTQPIQLIGEAFGPSPTSEIDFYQTQETKSYAVFGQTTFNLLDPKTHLTLGYRYTFETEYERSHICIPGVGCSGDATAPLGPHAANQQTDSSGPSIRASLAHDFTDTIMGYVSFNHSLKSGGFSLVTAADLPPYHPEKLNAYEIGEKGEFFNRRLRFNATAFYYTYTNMQVESFNVLVTTDNAGASTIYGADFDVEARPIKNLTLSASLGLLHTRYDDYAGATYLLTNGVGAVAPANVYSVLPTAAAPAGVPCTASPALGGWTQCYFNAKGKQLNFAPDVTTNFGAVYRIPTSIGDFTYDGELSYEASQYTSPDNLSEFVIPSRTLVNMAVTWESLDKHYSVRVWSRNIFDVNWVNDIVPGAAGSFLNRGDPQTFGVTGSAKF